MFKNLIAPVQAWLLANSMCVGCGTSLKQGRTNQSKVSGTSQVVCKCGRTYLLDDKTKKYRRALVSEI